MPTAVERLFDSFLRFAGIREQAALNDAFLKIDDDLLKLSTATTDSFLKIEQERSLKIDFDVIGDAFHKLGNDFLKIDLATRLVDDFVVKGSALTPGSVDGAPGLQTDFVTLDHKMNTSGADLKILGTDFLKLDTSPNRDVFELKLAGIGSDFLKLHDDMAADRDAFLKLGADFLKLGGGTDRASPLDLAYKELGGELQTVGRQFDALANDFLKLDAALHGGGGGAGRGTDSSAGGGGGAGDQVGVALIHLFQDFHVLGADLGALGDGAVKVIEDLNHHSFLTGSHGGGGGSG